MPLARPAAREIEAEQESKLRPFHLVAQNGQVEVVRTLIEAPAEIEAEQEAKLTPFHFATQNG